MANVRGCGASVVAASFSWAVGGGGATLIHTTVPYSRPFDGYGVIRPVPYYALFYLRPYFLRPVTVFDRFFTVVSVYGRCGALSRSRVTIMPVLPDSQEPFTRG
jgi:hypothetical protein